MLVKQKNTKETPFMDRIVNVGIIGCGGIANGKHMPSLSRVENVRMIAFCDIIEERATRAAEKYGAEGAVVYTDYKELLKNPDVEVVHVLTPNKEHSFITVDALYAGKHVMCEKPMAKTYAEALKMVEAAKATGKKLTVGYQCRQSAEASYAKEYINSGAMGEIYYANSYALRRRGTPNWGVFLNEEEQGGGPVLDIATHSLDMTLYLMNNYEPEVVIGKTHKKLEHPEAGNIWGDNGVSTNTLEEAACAFIRMKNGATVMLETSWALNVENAPDSGSCRLCGSRAGLSILNGELKINKVELDRPVNTTVDTAAGGVAFYSGKKASAADVEAANWIKCIVNDTDPVVLPEQALVVSRILEAIYESSRTGKAIYFN